GGLAVGSGQLLSLSHDPMALIEDLEREAVQPLAKAAVGAVVDDDGLDGELGPQVELPPWIARVLLGVGLATVAEGAASIAVDRLAGVATIARVNLRGLALPGDVAAIAVNFHFRQCQSPLVAGQLDADEPADRHLALGPGGRQLLRQALEQRLDLGIEA